MHNHSARKHVKALAIVAAAASVFVMTACSSGASNSSSTSGTSASGGGIGKVIFITHGGSGDSFFTPMQHGAEQAGKDQGATVTYEAAGDNVQKQVQMIQSAIAQKPAAIVTTLPNPSSFKSVIASATAAKIPVFSTNSGTTKYASVGSLGHVGEDEFIAGQGVGARFNSLGKKHVLCVLHERSNIALDDYCNGIKDKFSGKLTTLYVNGLSDLSGTQKQIQSALSSDKTIDGVYLLNAVVAPLAVTAAKAAGISPTIATWTLSADALNEIKDGSIAFAEDQQPYLEGYLSTTEAVQYVKYGVRPATAVLTGPNFITKDNAEQVIELTKKGLR